MENINEGWILSQFTSVEHKFEPSQETQYHIEHNDPTLKILVIDSGGNSFQLKAR